MNTIGDFSRALGTAAKCDPWAVEIFAEEVVRGGPAFAVSLVISAIEPTLRQLAELGAWQVSVAAICDQKATDNASGFTRVAVEYG